MHIDDSIFARYGIRPDREKNPEYIAPNPLPLVVRLTGTKLDDPVLDHNRWCREKAYYPENRAALDASFAAREKELANG